MKKGITLIETLVTLGLFVLVFQTLLISISAGNKLIFEARMKKIAINKLVSQIEYPYGSSECTEQVLPWSENINHIKSTLKWGRNRQISLSSLRLR